MLRTFGLFLQLRINTSLQKFSQDVNLMELAQNHVQWWG
jgi:hypothetical protein